MKTLFHIGFPKTATTWFQRNYYPFVTNASYIKRAETFKTIFQPGFFEYQPKDAIDKFNNLNNDLLIFCLENIVGTHHNFGLQGYMSSAFARRIKDTFPDSRIVLFIRNQPDIIASNYIQYIKGGGTYPIRKFIGHGHHPNLLGITLFDWSFFEYHHIINYYQDLFSPEKVHVFIYEEFIDDPYSFLENFGKVLDLQVDINNLNYEIQNPGYRRYIKSIARFVNRFSARKVIHKHYFFNVPGLWEKSRYIFRKLNSYKVFGKMLTTKAILPEEIYQQITDYYKKSNQILIEKYGLHKIKDHKYPL